MKDLEKEKLEKLKYGLLDNSEWKDEIGAYI